MTDLNKFFGPDPSWGTQNLVLLRGIPGAGKTTTGEMIVADKPRGWRHYSADDWRGYGDKRLYNNLYNQVGHAYCLGKAAEWLRIGGHVVVSNCFHTIGRMLPYWLLYRELLDRKHDVRLTILHVQGGWTEQRSIHGTGVEYDYYIKNWEHYNGECDFERLAGLAEERDQAVAWGQIGKPGRSQEDAQEEAVHSNLRSEQHVPAHEAMEDAFATCEEAIRSADCGEGIV